MTINRNFSATGAAQQWIVPANIVSPVTVTLVGADGDGTNDGAGGTVRGTLTVAAGDVLNVYVGTKGSAASGTAGGAGGFNGGGVGGTATGSGSLGASGGSGATDLRKNGSALTDRVAVAGGAGSGGRTGSGGDAPGVGGAGGAATGAAGTPGSTASSTGAGGGTQAAGGAGGSGSLGGNVGALGVGGAGAGQSVANSRGGGGGGGGYYGGGGAGSGATQSSGGGGGGSNYTGGFASVLTNSRGGASSRAGGSAIIAYTVLPDAPALQLPPSGALVDVASAVTFYATFSSDDTTDVPTTFRFRWRVGAGAWTQTDYNITGLQPNVWGFIAAANAWAAQTGQQIEWQAAFNNAGGNFGPFSASFYFTPITAPAAPTLVPAAGAALTSTTVTLTATMPTSPGTVQFGILDAGGATVAGPVDVNTGSGVTRSNTFTGLPLVTGATYRLRARWRTTTASTDTAWSPWTESAVTANVNPPPTPTVTVTVQAATQSVLLTITNPGGTYPAVSNDVQRRNVSTGGPWERIAAAVAPNTPVTDYAPQLNQTLEYRVVASSASGSTATGT